MDTLIVEMYRLRKQRTRLEGTMHVISMKHDQISQRLKDACKLFSLSSAATDYASVEELIQSETIKNQPYRHGDASVEVDGVDDDGSDGGEDGGCDM